MKVYEAAKLLERDAKELAAKLGLKSHLSNVSDSVLVELGLNSPDAPSGVTIEEARALMNGRGDKTIAFLEFVSSHKEELTDEYNRVKHLIERYL